MGGVQYESSSGPVSAGSLWFLIPEARGRWIGMERYEDLDGTAVGLINAVIN